MAPDDRADLVQGVPPELAEKLLELLNAREPTLVAETRALVSYGEDTAGGIMTTKFVAVGPEETVGAALERLNAAGLLDVAVFASASLGTMPHLVARKQRKLAAAG